MRIIQRAEWGARHPDGFQNAPMPASEVWLHHSVSAAPDLKWIDANGDGVDDDERAAMRQLEDIGQSRFGGGISYTWLVMPSGRIYQGHSPHRQGAHTGGRNDVARAVCLVGDYEAHAPTTAQLDAVAELLRYAKAKGWIQHAKLNGGHRDLKATACPGRHAYAAIAEINRRAAAPPEEDDMPTAKEVAAELLGTVIGERPSGGTFTVEDAIKNPFLAAYWGGGTSKLDGGLYGTVRRMEAAMTAGFEQLVRALTEDHPDIDTDRLIAEMRQAIADTVVDVNVTVNDATAATP